MVTTGSRIRTTTGAGVIAALLLVLVFGSPIYSDWARDNADTDTAGGWFLRLLAWPSWRFDSDDSIRSLLAADVRAILVVVLAWLFLTVMVGTTVPRSLVLVAWGAYIFAAALAGLLAAFIVADASLLGAFGAATAGAGYGLFTGWVVGLATIAGRRA